MSFGETVSSWKHLSSYMTQKHKDMFDFLDHSPVYRDSCSPVERKEMTKFCDPLNPILIKRAKHFETLFEGVIGLEKECRTVFSTLQQTYPADNETQRIVREVIEEIFNTLNIIIFFMSKAFELYNAMSRLVSSINTTQSLRINEPTVHFKFFTDQLHSTSQMLSSMGDQQTRVKKATMPLRLSKFEKVKENMEKHADPKYETIVLPSGHKLALVEGDSYRFNLQNNISEFAKKAMGIEKEIRGDALGDHWFFSKLDEENVPIPMKNASLQGKGIYTVQVASNGKVCRTLYDSWKSANTPLN